MKRIFLFIFSLVVLCQSAWAINLSWKGKMGEKISFRLDVEINENDHIGGQTTYYRSNGKTSVIPIVGFGGNYEGKLLMFLQEHLGKKVCGNYVIQLAKDGSIVEGVWTFNDRNYDLREMESVETTGETFLHPVDVVDAWGVYQFSIPSNNKTMPEYGGTAMLYAERQNLAYSFCQVTPNIAEVSNTTSEFWKSHFYLSKEPAHYDVVTYEECVIVNRSNPDAGMPEDFGMGADIVGIYYKTDAKLEGDIIHAFDEEHAFSETMPCSVFELNEAWMDGVGGETTFPDEIVTRDLDGDGVPEVLAHYTENRTDGYEVSNHRWAIFSCAAGEPQMIAKAEGDFESIKVEGPWIVTTKKEYDGSTTTHTYYKLSYGKVVLEAAIVEGAGKYFMIDGNDVTEKEFWKRVTVKKAQSIETFGPWREVPGNVYRNENAARG